MRVLWINSSLLFPDNFIYVVAAGRFKKYSIESYAIYILPNSTTDVAGLENLPNILCDKYQTCEVSVVKRCLYKAVSLQCVIYESFRHLTLLHLWSGDNRRGVKLSEMLTIIVHFTSVLPALTLISMEVWVNRPYLTLISADSGTGWGALWAWGISLDWFEYSLVWENMT